MRFESTTQRFLFIERTIFFLFFRKFERQINEMASYSHVHAMNAVNMMVRKKCIEFRFLTHVWLGHMSNEREFFFPVHQKPIFIFIECHEKTFCDVFEIKHNVYIILFSTCSWKVWKNLWVSRKKNTVKHFERTTIISDDDDDVGWLL